MIYINGRFLLQEQTGVNRFAYEICCALAHQKIAFVLICPYGAIKPCYDVADFTIRRWGYGKSLIWEQCLLPLFFWLIKGKKILVNFTGLSPLLVKNRIMTIHDLAFMENPAWYSKQYVFIYRLLTPICARFAKRIITVSEFSKNEIVHKLHISPQKIRVIYNAVSTKFAICLQANTPSRKLPYVLAVSSLDPRKNFINLLKAFSLLPNQEVQLWVVGGKNQIYNFTANEYEMDKHAGRIKWLGRVDDRELVCLYKNATCFIYPSLYEGFGIPPLEAMACGTATIVSNIPSLREVCGDAVLYTDPNNHRQIAKDLQSVLADSECRKELQRKGYIHYQKYSWEHSALQVCDLIQSIESEK